MSAPTSRVRTAVYDRDGGRCVLCNTTELLEWNHRAATGMGGVRRRPDVVEGVTLCHHCNTDIEADDGLMRLALARGVKIRKWVDPNLIPVYYQHEWRWYKLEGDDRVEVTAVTALDMMHACYGEEFYFRLCREDRDQYFRWVET